MRKSEDVKACNNLPNFIVQACDRYADKVAFYCGPSQLTYKEVEEKSRALACWFQHYTALQPGDRIAIQLPNILDFPIAAFAAMRAGLVLVNTNPLYTPREMLHQFSDSGAKAIVIFAPFADNLAAIIDNTDIDVVVYAGFAGDEPSLDCEKQVVEIGLPQALSTGQDEVLGPIVSLPMQYACCNIQGAQQVVPRGRV
ncbi:AMP-binding protein [Enterovibrio sp. Hal110]